MQRGILNGMLEQEKSGQTDESLVPSNVTMLVAFFFF